MERAAQMEEGSPEAEVEGVVAEEAGVHQKAAAERLRWRGSEAGVMAVEVAVKVGGFLAGRVAGGGSLEVEEAEEMVVVEKREGVGIEVAVAEVARAEVAVAARRSLHLTAQLGWVGIGLRSQW